MPGRVNFVETFHHDLYPSLEKPLKARACEGKVVFITGAGTGIGKATAHAFARAGARHIFIAGRTEKTLAATKADIEQESPKTKVDYFVLDICDAAKVTATFQACVAKAGSPIDILVNNAAYISFQDALGDADKIWSHFEVNVRGFMNVVRDFLANAVEKSPTIVNVSSGAAVIEFKAGLCPYSASKLATLKIMDYLHNEEKDGRGTRIFSIQPGNVATAMAAEGKTICDDTGESEPEESS